MQMTFNGAVGPVVARFRRSRRVAVLALLGAAACATAPHSIDQQEASPRWSGEAYENLLILGVYEDRPYRASAETAFTEHLRANGLEASPSYDVVPDLRSIDSEEDMLALLQGRAEDAILTVATIDEGYEFDYGDAMATRGWVYLLGGEPGAGTDLGNFIAWAGSGQYSLHLAVWDAATMDLVWQATTASSSTGSESEDLEALSTFVVSALKEKGIL